ncbi:hypothetical protein GGU45_000221 [Niabella hirudinis]
MRSVCQKTIRPFFATSAVLSFFVQSRSVKGLVSDKTNNAPPERGI